MFDFFKYCKTHNWAEIKSAWREYTVVRIVCHKKREMANNACEAIIASYDPIEGTESYSCIIEDSTPLDSFCEGVHVIPYFMSSKCSKFNFAKPCTDVKCPAYGRNQRYYQAMQEYRKKSRQCEKFWENKNKEISK